ncbi:DNA topoisomerase I [Candidatus Woesearchaeota archaeon]|nr:DNA topoisomerase I [Candidatus Woesearchaeota archaeon]
MKKYELLIAEKPTSAKKIAEALAEGKVSQEKNKKVTYFAFTHNGKEIVIASCLGHLYGLVEKEKNGWKYPTFSYEWKPIYEVQKRASQTKDFIDTLKKLAKNADDFTVCTDFDDEGTVLGLNAIRFACGQKDAHRMKFSTLTKKDLIASYQNKMKHMDWGQANAGLTRHELDWIYGINNSRALTLALKTAGMFKILSTGRVQGPALKIIVDKDREINKFKAETFWQIKLQGEVDKEPVLAWHEEGKFWEKQKAETIFKKTQGKKAIVSSVKKKEMTVLPPFPFDLTTLQTEAYRCFGISPKETMSITQGLYLNGYISYPRSSSNKLPVALDYKKIIQDLGKQSDYKALSAELLKKKMLKPNEGPKVDPAHPAVHATGELPKKMAEREAKVYDLIARRTLATFADPAVNELMKAEIDVNGENFIARGSVTKVSGWYTFYGAYAKEKDEELPPMNEGTEIKNPKIEQLEDQTKPPKRYTPASIIKELEKRNLGTKSTRSSIVDTLYQRQYVHEKSIEATKLGVAAIETLEKYCPEIIDERLTRHFEEETELIREEKRKPEEIIEEAKKELTKILANFKKHEKEIGQGLLLATKETRTELSAIAPCPLCKKGDLQIRYSPRFKSNFIGCSAYPNCKATFGLPQGLPKPTKNFCKECNFPEVLIIRQGKRPFNYCINKQCKLKEEWLKKQQEKQSKVKATSVDSEE